ncbi:hypothetical protein BOC52_36030 [Burkholderia pseudomallei]|nr:hypothetical protein BK015_13325 [Burkholderia pseudomallei]ARL61547.1 hypothetical protein BOC52_36030 [Burkholderia pseudomallei]ARL67981.1 hypothetical protein BOC53_33110 [Burkholderia pseudomallei]
MLEIESDSDERAVRRAYARVLKQQRADENPEQFQALRGAYEHALMLARHAAQDVTIGVVEADSADRGRQPNGAEGRSLDGETSRGGSGETPDRPELPPPVDTLDVADEATRIWDAFASEPNNVTSRRSITELFASVVGIALRDELEWRALLYCLRDDIPHDCRGDIAAVLNWRESSGHLMQRNVFVARQALTKIFADDEYHELERRFPLSVDLLDQPHPGMAKALFRLIDGARLRAMQTLIFSLQTSFTNARILRFDSEQIAFWERACAYRAKWGRLGTMVPLLGVWCGVLLAKGMSVAHSDGDHRAWSGREWAVVALVALLTMLVYGIAVLGSSPLSSRWKRIARENLGARYGWIGLWVTAACAAYADQQGGIVTAVALGSLSISSAWAVAVHGWPRLRGLLIVTAYAAGGFGFYSYFVHVFGGPWQLPIAQGALYGMFSGFVQDELRGTIARWRRVHRAAVATWLVGGAVTALLLVAPDLADAGLAWVGPSWSAYALLIVVGSMLGNMRWGQLSEVFPSMFRGYGFILWFGVALTKASFAAFVVLCVMGFWIVQDILRTRRALFR